MKNASPAWQAETKTTLAVENPLKAVPGFKSKSLSRRIEFCETQDFEFRSIKTQNTAKSTIISLLAEIGLPFFMAGKNL
jgi:hypothetical protein